MVLVATLATACGGGGSGGSSNADADSDSDSRSGADAAAAAAAALAQAPGGRCDLGFNTARFNQAAELVSHMHDHDVMAEVDFTVREWASAFVDEDLGMSVDEVAQVIEADDIDRRHVLGGVLTHSLDPDPWVPMTDAGACDRLAAELAEARAAAARFPTVADAVAAGYTQGDTYNAGLGVHYQDLRDLMTFRPGQPAQLLFDGTDPDSTLVGLSYVVARPGTTPPVGFTGDNDRWHRHRTFCLDVANAGVNLSADVLSEAECAALGGAYLRNIDWWMVHAWVVSGCESDWGIFSSANPSIPFRPDGVSFEAGCDSGNAVTDPLDFEASGNGPTIG